MSRALTGTAAYNGKQPGDPQKGVQVILDLLHGDGLVGGKPFPLSIQLGSDCYSIAKDRCQQGLAHLEEWKDVSFSTDFAKDA